MSAIEQFVLVRLKRRWRLNQAQKDLAAVMRWPLRKKGKGLKQSVAVISA